MSTPNNHYLPIADYALIGDCHTAALVGKNGSIDWYCPGRFDAPAVLWRMLDAQKGGYFQVAPRGDFRVRRRYVGPTNVLETTFECPNGLVRLTDFMPIHRRQTHRLGHDVGTTRQILRMLEAEGQPCPIELRFKPAFNFGRSRTELTQPNRRGAMAHADGL
ncbi:MAG: hypothetical protein JO247_13995 [Chloroflexi bacterium]|nr:hypothetical protein [Chloroflexota bacterium]